MSGIPCAVNARRLNDVFLQELRKIFIEGALLPGSVRANKAGLFRAGMAGPS